MKKQEALRIWMPDLMEALGHPLTRYDAQSKEYWYRSPFSDDANASMHIKQFPSGYWGWKCFSTGKKGGLIDFCMQVWNLDFGHTLGKLASLNLSPSSSPAPAMLEGLESETESRIENFRTKALHHPALFGYLKTRGIPVELARMFLEEAHYEINGKPYFSLAFKNQREGYELRNPYSKVCYPPKDITVLVCSGAGLGDRPVRVYEGFMDFLSDLVVSDYKPGAPLPFSAVILNSASMKDKALAAVRTLHPSEVSLYFDHDKTGRMLSDFFDAGLPDYRVFDRSQDYAPYKDLNEWLKATCGLQQGR